MQTAQHLNWHAGIDRPDVHRGHVDVEIGLTMRKPFRVVDVWIALYILNFGEAVGAQLPFGKVGWRPAVPTVDPSSQTYGSSFYGRLLRMKRFRRRDEE